MLNIHQIHLKWVVATIPRFHTGGPFGSGTRLRHPCKPLGGLRCHDVVQDLWCHRKADETPGLDFFFGKMYWKPWKIHEGFTNQMYWEKNMLPNTIRIYWEQVAIQICQNYSSFSNVLYVCSEQWLKKLSTFFSPTPFNLLLTSKPNLGPITDIHCKHDPHI